MALSATRIANAKPRGKAYKISDGNTLYLLVRPGGSKLWRMNYRFLNRQRTLYIGRWPDVGLAAARQKRDEARRLLASGTDPAVEKKLRRVKAELSAMTTFESVAAEWVQKITVEGRAPITIDKIEWLLDMAYPALGSRPIADLTAPELLLVLRKLESAGNYESAARMRSVFSRVFRYGIATSRCERDIAADLRGALISPKTKHLAAITKPEAAGALLRAIEGYDGQEITAYALKLSAHLFVRPGELRTAEWTEIDGMNAVWSIPAEKMKMRRPHRVPLSVQALDVLEAVHGLTGHGKYVFPSVLSQSRPMSENTVNSALRRLGYAKTEMTAHGFRAMAATLLNEMGLWHPDAIERQLAHVEASEVRRAYARGEYWDERVRMMQHWSDYLDTLRDRVPNGRLKFRRRA